MAEQTRLTGERWITLGVWTTLMLCVAWALQGTQAAPGLWVLSWIVLGGVAWGVIAAHSHLRGSVVGSMAVGYGAAWTLLWIGRLLPEGLPLRERWIELGQRVWVWGKTVWEGGQGDDALIFVLLCALWLWGLAVGGSWLIFRHNRRFGALVLPLSTLIVTAYYGPREVRGFLAIGLVLALLLVGHMGLALRAREWRQVGVRYGGDVVVTLLFYALLVAILVVSVAWWIPRASREGVFERAAAQLEGPWNWIRETWRRAFSTLRGSQDEERSGVSFGSTLPLGGAVRLSERPVMDVHASGISYWRAVAYDTYTGQEWESTVGGEIRLEGGRIGEQPSYTARRVITQTYTIWQEGETLLYGAPEPIWVSIPVEVAFDGPEDDGAKQRPQVAAVAFLQSLAPLHEGDRYRVASAVDRSDVQSLREAGEAYPEWVKARYLQIPSTLPERVRRLALEVTADATNPYDKAVAIERFLRSFRYDEEIDPPPEGQDAVDYFLFDVRAGYCNYYASAMVMMARTVGIPARLAVGYAGGQWMPDIAGYRVRERDAHAWPEIYFPGHGWVIFEPTPSRPPIVRLERARPTAGQPGIVHTLPVLEGEEGLGGRQPRATPSPEGEERTATSGIWWRSWWLWIGGIASLGAFVGWWLRKHKPQGGAARVYHLLIREGSRWGLPIGVGETPYEYALKVGEALPQEKAPIWHLVESYVAERYGRKSTSEDPAAHWPRIRRALRRWGIRQLWLRWRRERN